MHKIFESFVLVLKGSIIGLANLIPGVSGGTIAVSMGVYKPLIKGIASVPDYLFKRDRKCTKNIIILLLVLLGMILVIFGFSKQFSHLLRLSPIGSQFFFTGLILGSLPAFMKFGNFRPFKLSSFLSFFITVIIVGFLTSFKGKRDFNIISLSFTGDTALRLTYLFWIFGCGILASIAMILPGVSGSLLLVILGEYKNILHMVGIMSSFKIDTAEFVVASSVFVFFTMGIGLGIYSCARLITYLMSRYKMVVESCILGLILVSAISSWSIIKRASNVETDTLRWFVYGIILIAGFSITYFFGQKSHYRTSHKKI